VGKGAIFSTKVINARSEEQAWSGVKAFFAKIVDNINEVAAIKNSWINRLIGEATFWTMLALGVVCPRDC
jgi:hypothetical protein